MNRTALKVLMTAAVMALFLLPAAVSAHCDTMDGPVVTAAKKAIETGDVNYVLVWVQKPDEKAIIDALKETLAVRKLGKEAAAMADRYFFETLVRIHRAGEGAPYTGLKPAGTEVEPAIAAADRAVETGNPEEAVELVVKEFREGMHNSFHKVHAASGYKKDDVKAGRGYVKEYVEFIHYVERVYEAAKSAGAAYHEGH